MPEIIRYCSEGCGRQIIACNGFVNAGDWLEASDGKRPWSAVREHCAFCAEQFARHFGFNTSCQTKTL